MPIEVTQIIDQPDKDYPENYGSKTVVVQDTETGRVETATVDYDYFTSRGEATAKAIKEASDKL